MEAKFAYGGFVIVRTSRDTPFTIHRRTVDGEAGEKMPGEFWRVGDAMTACNVLRRQEAPSDGKPNCGDRCE